MDLGIAGKIALVTRSTKRVSMLRSQESSATCPALRVDGGVVRSVA